MPGVIPPKWSAIVAAVADVWDVPEDAVGDPRACARRNGRPRSRLAVEARGAACLLAQRHTRLSSEDVAERLGCDHSTVLLARRRFAQRAGAAPVLAALLAAAEDRIRFPLRTGRFHVGAMPTLVGADGRPVELPA